MVIATEEDLLAPTVTRLLSEYPPHELEPQAFWEAQFDAGLARVHFPPGLGGLGLGRDRQHEVNTVLDAAGVPRPEHDNLVGVNMLGPTLIEHGTPEQQRRYIRAAFACREMWCQLFSEPGAGSDLASLRTRAELDGDTWVVTGQKVWSTMAHRADYGLLLARTEPGPALHGGLSYFILDMDREGVEVRPLRQITGGTEYSEVFLTEARIPDGQRIGSRGDGWRVALSTLMTERVGLQSAIGPGPGDGVILQALAAWNRQPAETRSAVHRQHLTRLWIETEVLRLTILRAESAERSGAPGPAGSILKLAFGAVAQGIAEFCTTIDGAAGLLVDYTPEPDRPIGTTAAPAEQSASETAQALLTAQALTIAGGTTNINKNIVAERVLGLPRERRA
jgi:alkylation response protein AidB-like acyl-CoA dehydrogenase